MWPRRLGPHRNVLPGSRQAAGPMHCIAKAMLHVDCIRLRTSPGCDVPAAARTQSAARELLPPPAANLSAAGRVGANLHSTLCTGSIIALLGALRGNRGCCLWLLLPSAARPQQAGTAR